MADIDTINHVGIVARSHRVICGRFEAMGFQLTPFSAHEGAWKPGGAVQPLGTGNRCVMFADSFLEILGSVDEDRPAPRITGFLQRHQGAHIICFGTADIEAVAVRLNKTGIENSGVLPLQREVKTPDGMRTMRVKRLQFTPGATAEGYIQVAQHLTPEYIHQPRFMHHANAGYRLSDVLIIADDMARLVARYAGYLGSSYAVTQSGVRFQIGDAFGLHFASAMDAARLLPGSLLPPIPGIASITFRTASVERASELLKSSGIAFVEHEEGLILPAQEAGGVAVRFER